MISSDARTARERLLAAASELIDTLAQQGITQLSSHEQAALSPPPDPTRDTAPSIDEEQAREVGQTLATATSRSGRSRMTVRNCGVRQLEPGRLTYLAVMRRVQSPSSSANRSARPVTRTC